MGTVMIRCPETGRDIPTGIVADRESFQRHAGILRTGLVPDLPRPSTNGSPRKPGCASPSLARVSVSASVRA